MTLPLEPVTIASGLRFHPSLWSVGISLLLLAAMAAVCLLGWWRSGFRPAVGGLELLRLAVAVIVALLLNQPEWVTQQRPSAKPSIAVLLDDSRSMDTIDAVESSVGDRGEGPVAVSRRESVAEIGEASFWKPLEQRFEIHIEPFSLVNAEGASGGSDLFSPLDAAPKRHANLRAIVLASDGDWNAGQPPVRAATALRLSGVPVFVVPAGSTIPLPDVSVASLDCAVSGVVGKPFRIPFTLQSTLPREESLTVAVDTSDGQSFTKQVRLASMGRSTEWIHWTPASVGDFTVTIRVPPQPGELLADNNQRTAPVVIRREKLRVLVVESLPRWEYRYLRNALSRDPGVELSCLLFHPGLSRVGGGNKDSIQKFPGSLEELAAFDVVFLGDVGLDDGQLTAEDCRLLKELVEYQASGVVFMPGWLGKEMSLGETPLVDLLPVVLDESRPEGTGTSLPGRFALTDKGRGSVLARLADSEEENVSVWESLPGFQWYAPVLRAKAGAEVLAVHDDAANEYGRIPLLVTRSFGAGKVLFMATDGAWRWRKGVEDKYHYRFWGQVVRWMAYRRTMAKGERMRLLFSPEQPEVGQVVSLDANVSDGVGEPVQSGTVTVLITAPSGATETVRLFAPGEQGAWGVFSGSFTPREPGSHTMVLACAETGDRLEAGLFVQGTPGESPGGAARPDVLEEIARLTHGSTATPDALQELLVKLRDLPENPPDVRRERLWAHPLALATVVGLLGLFWVGRKWQGLV
ncbi:MAG: hypothetical protein DWH79_02260 [Planctomycetota bacterium]|nr:MAG: hypothetical protein DWH79_02260 [Planctomycetota bacterium]